MKKNRFLKRMTIFGFVVLLALSFSSVALGMDIYPSHINLLTGWSGTDSATVYNVFYGDYTALLNDGKISLDDMTWNGLTISVSMSGTVYVSGSPTSQGATTVHVAAVVTSGDEALIVDTASLSISCVGETTPLPSGSSLSIWQIKISDKDGEHASTYLRPQRHSLIEIPIVEEFDMVQNPITGTTHPDIMGVYVYSERDGEDTGKIYLPANSKLPGDLTADGYRYDSDTNTFWVNFYAKQTGEYTFKFYYYQDGSLRLQERTLTGEIPGGDSGSGGCATGIGFAAMALMIGFGISRRKR